MSEQSEWNEGGAEEKERGVYFEGIVKDGEGLRVREQGMAFPSLYGSRRRWFVASGLGFYVLV